MPRGIKKTKCCVCNENEVKKGIDVCSNCVIKQLQWEIQTLKKRIIKLQEDALKNGNVKGSC